MWPGTSGSRWRSWSPDRYVAEDALELVVVEYDPLDPVAATRCGRDGRVVSDRSFSYGDPDAAFAAADLVVEGRFGFPRWAAQPRRVLRRRLRLGRRRRVAHRVGELPGPVHAPRGRGRRARPAGREAAADHAARLRRQLRLKAAVYAYVVLIGLASRKLGVPVRWTEDRLEHLAPRRHVERRASPISRRRSPPTASCSRCATTSSRTSAPTSARRSRRRSTGCTARSRARTACRNVAARNRVVVTNRCPTSLNRGFGGPQLYFALERTMDRAARGSASIRPSCGRRNLVPPASSPTARPPAASTTPATTRRASTDALERVR